MKVPVHTHELDGELRPRGTCPACDQIHAQAEIIEPAADDRRDLGPADCHGSALALALWEHDADELRFCHHCSVRQGPALQAKGWTRTYVNLAALNDYAAPEPQPETT